MIAIFVESHHLSLQNQTAVLSKKPDSIKLGNQTYKTVTMHFQDMDAEFLITIVKNTTYTFFLVAVDKNEAKRKAYLDLLLSQLKAIEYH
jgi:hypothetical protein